MFPCTITKRCPVLLNSSHMEPKKLSNHAESIGLKPCPGLKWLYLLGLWKSFFISGWIEMVDWCFIFLYTGQINQQQRVGQSAALVSSRVADMAPTPECTNFSCESIHLQFILYLLSKSSNLQHFFVLH